MPLGHAARIDWGERAEHHARALVSLHAARSPEPGTPAADWYYAAQQTIALRDIERLRTTGERFRNLIRITLGKDT